MGSRNSSPLTWGSRIILLLLANKEVHVCASLSVQPFRTIRGCHYPIDF